MIRKRLSKMFGTRVPVGRASRRRIQGGGRLALGRPSANREAWHEIRAQVLARARWICQACGVRRRLEVHHLIKRAQGGSDFDLDHLVALCRSCHAQTDAPYARGRLVITPSGGGRVVVAVVRAPSKWEVRQQSANCEPDGVPAPPQTEPSLGHAAATGGAGNARQATREGTQP